METTKRYYEDAYLQSCTATVLACEERKGGYAIILDRTVFYPEGGGQPGDRGTLNEITVLDTHSRGDAILHYTTQPIAPGTEVAAQIDWEYRFDLMQQHSGEHMISGVVHRRWGYDNVGFHMGADMITIDFSGILTMQQLQEVEQEVNRRIWENSTVKIWYPDKEELSALPYRSKKELTGAVRIVEFPGADMCACCGTHVSQTGAIGMVKLLTCVKFHEGVRIELLCGRRAVAYLTAINNQNRLVSQQLSAKVMETAQAVSAMAAELERSKQRIYAMESERFTEKAEALRGQGDVCVFFTNLNPDGVRRAAAAIQETCGGRAAVFSGSDADGYKYAIGLPGGDLRAWVKELNTALSGRGGGKPFFVQGSVQALRLDIEAWLKNH